MSNFGKRVNNLLTKFRVDKNSILFSKGETLEDKTVKKLLKSKDSKDIVLYNLYKEYIKNGEKKGDFKTKKIVINTPFVQERSSTQREDMLHTIDGPMQLVHADITDLSFFSKSAVATKYCLLCVNMFTSKTYIYSMKKRASWQRNSKKFYWKPRSSGNI